MRFQAVLLVASLQVFSSAAAAQNTETNAGQNGTATLEERAASGDIQAQLEIAQAFQHGLGREKNPSEAIRWYTAAAEQDNALAMFELGSLVFSDFNAEDTSPDARLAAAKSVEWFHSSAKLGFAPAQSTLGLLYGFGDRVDVDRVTGRMWMEIAVKNGHRVQRTMKRAVERGMSDQELSLALSRAEACLSSSYEDCD